MSALPGFHASTQALASRFPARFVWGAATAAYQIEGAVAEDGRGESIWDRFCQQPGTILDGSSGAVACDHYHRLADDVALMARLGIRAYRFSLAWPRVQPEGQGKWNEAGMAFYARLLDLLAQHGIAAHATLYHWDLPQALQERGGWDNRETIGHFVAYAREVGRRFGDRLASLCTFNEPWVVATLGHEVGIFAPGLRDRALAFRVSHHLLLAHAQALQCLRADGVACPLGIVLNLSPTDPLTPAATDRARARLEDGLLVRWYLDPLLRGHYPADVLAWLGDDAPAQAAAEASSLAVPLDFLGINFYARNVAGENGLVPATERDCPVTAMGWEVRSASLTELLVRLHRDYTLPPLYITENGAAFDDVKVADRVADARRTDYITSHIGAVADALAKGVDIRAYFVWSLLDNFEWAHGYSRRFGIVHVDYATQERTPKDSAWWYSSLLAAHLAQQRGGGG